MIANEKLDLLALKNALDEGGTNRITPKDIRDAIVSSYGSRKVDILVDSGQLNENHEVVIARMIEDDNYFELPDSNALDSSGTPYKNKEFHILNFSDVYSLRVITKPTNVFADGTREIVIEPMGSSHLVAHDYWYELSSGAGGSGGGGTGQQLVRDFNENTTEDILMFDTTELQSVLIEYTITLAGGEVQAGQMNLSMIDASTAELDHSIHADIPFEPMDYFAVVIGTEVYLRIQAGVLGSNLRFKWKFINTITV